MQHSNLSSKQNSQNNVSEKKEILPPLRGESEGGSSQKAKRGKMFAFVFLILALIGFADATYLTLKHFNGGPITCSLTHGCDEVTSSAYSEIFGIPVALFGALYYLGVILLAVLYLDKKKEQVLSLISKLTWIGLGAAIYFTYIQAVILNAWCQYCIGSAITSTLLFITGMTYLHKHKKLDAPPAQE